MKRPFTLSTVANTAESTDTGRCITKLMSDVAEKKLIGIAYVAIYAQRNYEVNACGEADRSPTFARGALAVLDDRLSAMIHKRD